MKGVSPARYLTRLRMEEAARLLRADPASIKEIARRSGFSDPNYFGKVIPALFRHRTETISGAAECIRAQRIRLAGQRRYADGRAGRRPTRATDRLASNGAGRSA